MESRSFGDLLRRMRRAAGLTQDQLAERAYLSARAISDLERGLSRTPRKDTLQLLADGLELESEDRELLRRAVGALSTPVRRPSAVTLTGPPLPPLIGRDREVADIRQMLRQDGVRLITLLGPGGVGKTRLATQVASETQEAQVFIVSLETLNSSELVAPALAHSLGISESGVFAAQVAARLRLDDTLLMVDNLEQVVDAAPLFSDLLAACPSLKLLVTSRTVLGLRAEHVIQVLPLDVPPAATRNPADALRSAAVTLFADRARAARADFVLTEENTADVVEICRLLEGIPLAIELAAARVRMLPPPALLRRLRAPASFLDLLSAGPRDLPVRQRTLRAAVGWSYDLLTSEEQRLFARLSIFAGGCALEAAEAVCGGDIDVFGAAASLLDKSLLQRDSSATEDPRLDMFEVIREYAREQLQLGGEREQAADLHAHYFLERVQAAPSSPDQRGRASWLDRLQADHANLRAALDWLIEEGRTGECHRFAAAIWRFWNVRGYLTEGAAYLDRILDMADGRPDLRAEVNRGTAMLAYARGDYAAAEVLLGQALELWRSLGDWSGVADALGHLGAIAHDRGEYQRAQQLYEEALLLRRKHGDELAIANSLQNLGLLVHDQGRYREAAAFFDEALPILARLDDSHGLAVLLSNMADAARHAGDHARASELLGRSLELCRAIGDRQGIAVLLADLGKLRSLQGDQGIAVALLQESLAMHQELRDEPNLASGLERFAEVAQAAGQPVAAARLIGAADELRERIGSPRPPIEQPEIDDLLTHIRECLGESGLATARREGSSMSLHELAALDIGT